MTDQEFILHYASEHLDDALESGAVPQHSPQLWNVYRSYHDTLHRLWPNRYDHDHGETPQQPKEEAPCN